MKLRWSEAENALIDRFARDLLDGRYPDAEAAALICAEELERLRKSHPNEPWAAKAKTEQAVLRRISESARATGGRWPRARFTKEQNALIQSFVTGLVQGKYRSAREAVRQAVTALEQSARKTSPGLRQAVQFNWRTVQQKILDQAEAQGWRDVRGWSKQEMQILDGYGRDVMKGRYRNAMVAARAYLQDLEDLRRKHRGAEWLKDRTLNGVFLRLVKRMKLMSDWSEALWPEPEFELADRFARGVVDGRYPKALEAARDFLRARDEMRERHPEIVWLRRRRSLRSAERVVCQRARKLGWAKLFIPWAAPERLVLDKCAQAIARGQYASILKAAPACTQEIAQLHGLHPEARWTRVSRTVGMVENQLQDRVKKLGIARSNGFWTQGELAIVNRYARRVGKPGYRRMVDAANECLHGLERRHSRELLRKPFLAPVQPRTMNAIKTKLKLRAVTLGTWGRNAGKVKS